MNFSYYIWKDQSKQLKLDKEPKTPKQKIAGWALSIVVGVWNVRNKPKIENESKTPKQKIMGRALSIEVCVWNVRNKPKT